ncbi:hypothetical protein GCM10023155_33620 [Bremerella cremea]
MLGKDAMKNIYLRLAVIGGVVALGATAIGQSMMASRGSADPEPIEISQIPPGEPTQLASASFPQSQVVLASNDTPAEPESAKPAASEPPAQPAVPTPASRFRFSDSGEAATPVSTENPASGSTTTVGGDNSPPSRFSRFPAPPTAADSEAAGTSNPAAPPAGGNRFSIGDSSPEPTSANPAAGGAPSMPPRPQSFASDAEPTPAAPGGVPAPPVRFQMGDNSAIGQAAEQIKETANGIAADANAATSEASAAIQGAVDSANSRFSSMAGSASNALREQAEAVGNAVNSHLPPPNPMASGFSATATPTPAAVPQPAMPGYGSPEPSMPSPPPTGRFSTTDMAGSNPAASNPSAPSTPQPSVIGSAPPASFSQTRGFSATPAPPATMPEDPRPTYQPEAQPQPRFGGEQPTAIASRAPVGAPTGMLVSARPGDSHLEGDQQPSIRLEKVAPPEVQVGKVAIFELHVENNGQVEASNVMIRDMVPSGTKLVSSNPQAQQGSDGSLTWDLGTLRPQQRQTIKLEILPLEEGNIGSVASVSFAAKASARSIVTRPKLTISQSSAATVLAGNQLGITITIANPGTGAATGVVLEENVPGNFTHPAGKELEFEVGTLKPGESRQLDLVLNAVAAGNVQNMLRARADGNLTAEHALPLEVVAPQLQVAMTGPKLRYLERPAKYTVSISNPGTAPAHEIDLVTYLPKGLKFVEANNAGQYDATRHAVFWSLQELPPSQTGTVELVALPIEPGDQRLRVEGSANKGLTAEDESTIHVEGLAAIFFEVADQADPIEVGKDTTYDIKVVNQGSKEATNVQVTATLPQGMQAMAADGEVPGSLQGNQIIFQPIARLDPKQTIRLSIQAQGTMPGDQRIRVQVRTDGIPDPITKEESTTVYTDR